jgi:hypothetical protein
LYISPTLTNSATYNGDKQEEEDGSFVCKSFVATWSTRLIAFGDSEQCGQWGEPRDEYRHDSANGICHAPKADSSYFMRLGRDILYPCDATVVAVLSVLDFYSSSSSSSCALHPAASHGIVLIVPFLRVHGRWFCTFYSLLSARQAHSQPCPLQSITALFLLLAN